MEKQERYEFEVGEGGSKGLDLLDIAFNPASKEFIQSYIKPGMHVLDVGCGSGVMTRWLAKQVGPTGKVLGIDNSEHQLKAAFDHPDNAQFNHIHYKQFSIYDILSLQEKFDLIYCRFVLHHVHSPRKAISLFYEALNKGGYYIGEEGIISAAFAYPPNVAWNGYMPALKSPDEEKDGIDRDGDFGMKLFYVAKQAGFEIASCQLQQPLLWKKEIKALLLIGLQEFKKAELAKGTTEQAWQQKYTETERMVNDDNQVIAFYGSCQVAGRK